MVLKERLHRSSLIARHSENVTEASSGEDNLFACAFRICNLRTRVDLSGSDGSDEGAARRERGVESNAGGIFGT